MIEPVSALARAAKECKPDKLKELMDKGDDIHVEDTLKQTPLILCIRGRVQEGDGMERMLACATMLIDAGANIQDPDGQGQTPLILSMCASGPFKVPILKLLLGVAEW